MKRGIAARTDQNQIEAKVVSDFLVGSNRKAARCLDRTTLRRDMNPFVERPAGQPVGRAKRFDRRGVGQQREAREQQEADLAGRRGIHAGLIFCGYIADRMALTGNKMSFLDNSAGPAR